jgi:hypothetical protein
VSRAGGYVGLKLKLEIGTGNRDGGISTQGLLKPQERAGPPGEGDNRQKEAKGSLEKTSLGTSL